MAKTRKYLPVVKGIPNYLVPDQELVKPWRGWEAEAHGLDEGTVTVILFCKDVEQLRKEGRENRLF